MKTVRRDVERKIKTAQKVWPKDNLSSGERRALNNLRTRRDIVIKPADKGSAVVVLSKEDYILEAERQLSNTAYYSKLAKDPSMLYATDAG